MEVEVEDSATDSVPQTHNQANPHVPKAFQKRRNVSPQTSRPQEVLRDRGGQTEIWRVPMKESPPPQEMAPSISAVAMSRRQFGNNSNSES